MNVLSGEVPVHVTQEIFIGASMNAVLPVCGTHVVMRKYLPRLPQRTFLPYVPSRV